MMNYEMSCKSDYARSYTCKKPHRARWLSVIKTITALKTSIAKCMR